MDKRKKKEGKTKRKRGGKSDRGEKEKTWEKRKIGGEKKREISQAFRWLNLDGYSWVPKSRSFVKLQEVGNFPTWIISSLKAI